MFEQMKLEQIVAEALAGLSERERYVLEKRYGYRGDPVMQKDLAAEFGISAARIGQIEGKALRRIWWENPEKLKELQPFLYQALSQGNDNFYARFFTKVFDLSKSNVLHILESGSPTE